VTSFQVPLTLLLEAGGGCRERADSGSPSQPRDPPTSSSVLLSSLEWSDTKVYEPEIRALLGTASHFCEVVVLKLITVPLLEAGGGCRERADGGCPSQPRHQPTLISECVSV